MLFFVFVVRFKMLFLIEIIMFDVGFVIFFFASRVGASF